MTSSQNLSAPNLSAPNLSALVVVHDEAAQLADCLRALAFCGEIVVVLDRCSDTSKAIAEAAGAKTVEGAWPVEMDRRNTGIAACRGNWILEVDADERVTSTLAAEIRQAIQAPIADLYNIPFDNYIGSRLVRHGWGQNVGVRSKTALFRKGSKTWGKGLVHPRLHFAAGARHGGKLQNAMVHHVDRDISDLIRRIDRYTTLQAAELRDSRLPSSGWQVSRRLASRFLRAYIFRRGYREGALGFLMAALAGLSPLIAHVKAHNDKPE